MQLTCVEPVGGHSLVLGDEPATATYPPDERAFLRWSAADSGCAPPTAKTAPPGCTW